MRSLCCIPAVVVCLERGATVYGARPAVRRDASHHQVATIMAKAPTSAAPLNAPRPAARPMSIRCRFPIGQQLDRTFQLGVSRRPRVSWIETGGAIKERRTAFPL